MNSLWDILPLPILVGMFIWTFSMYFFSFVNGMNERAEIWYGSGMLQDE
jgi:hypothetical protein